jgi:malate dehydrogenase (oxaloacetate-decarboxylating)(NADP+)
MQEVQVKKTTSSETGLRGRALLESPKSNKDTAFTLDERRALGLEGLLPSAVETIDMQHQRVLQQLGQKTTNLERYIYLNALVDTNETLFYNVVMSNPAYFLPILYDPTIAEACLKFSHIYRRPHGMYISIKDRGHVRERLANWQDKDVRVICATSGGRILGLGDLGANGMGIPIGKLQLYTACAGVPPDGLLPIFIDFGTENSEALNDPLYIGIRQKRPPLEQVDPFVDEFVYAVQQEFKDCCIHFEDWRGTDALHYLARYRNQVCCFNDDIQGTGSITVAGLVNAMRITKQNLKDQTVLFFGAGSAGIGNALMVSAAMQLEGLSADQARNRIWMFDINGLLEDSRKDLIPEQLIFTHKHAPTRDLLEAINSIRPTILIGVSTVGKAFNQQVIEAMSKITERPVIFALSNPTERAECTPEEAYGWSDGRAIYAAGVQFPPVTIKGKTFLPGQANNFYIYPSIGFAVYATHAKRVTDEMFIEAARSTADIVTDEQRSQGLIFPPQSNVLEAEIRTAVRVSTLIFDRNLAGVDRPSDVNAWLRSMVYKPDYNA